MTAAGSFRDPAGPARLVRARRVHTPAGPVEALLIRGGRVLAAGPAEELRRLGGDAPPLDLPECTITAGLTDAHVHLVEWALARRQVDLSRAPSPDAAARAAADAAHSAGADGPGWVRGRGWDPHRWSEPPHRRHLDALIPDRPVVLQSHDMHSLWANSVALERAGIDDSTPDPEGGRIERDPEGRATGIVRDNAMPLLLDTVPAPSQGERTSALAEGQNALHRVGLVGVHTVEPDSFGLLEAFRAADRLRLRVLQHLPLAKLDDAIRVGLRSGFGGDWLRIGGIKMFLDGALGSRTAWLREPYEGSEDRGVITLPLGEFRDAVRRGAAAGLAMTVHAIGDAAVERALAVLSGPDARLEGPVPHRIEHAQLMPPEPLSPPADPAAEAMRAVILSVQPSHLMTDWRAADRHWGARGDRTYAFRSMERAGFTLALGSDAPVEPPDPRHGLYAAVLRRDLDGAPEPGWYPDEALSMDRAWAGYTSGAALAAGDPRQGRLAPGSFADLVAWDRDPFAVPAPELLELTPEVTMVGGEVVWSQ